VLEGARLYETARAAVADLHYVLAATARQRGQMKRVLGPAPAMEDVHARILSGQAAGVLFGRERTGLENDEVALADAIVTFPVSPEQPSLNLAQAVLLVGYEWFKVAAGNRLPFGSEGRSPPATRATILSFFEYVEAELDAVNFYPPGKKPGMARNMRDMFLRMGMSEQDVRTIRGAVRAIAEARRARKGE
jgi:tRNA/rRNA methyltransferase